MLFEDGIKVGLNWTKVGLKDKDPEHCTTEQSCLNWTKVGLKALQEGDRLPLRLSFELD